MSFKRVNRAALDGTTVSVIVGASQFRCTKIGYGDSLTIAKGTRLGSQQQDFQTLGSYKTDDISFTMEAVDYREMIDAHAVNGFGNLIGMAIVQYSHPDIGSVSDMIEGFRLLTSAASAEGGEKMLEIEVKASCMQIYWGDRRATLNYVPSRARAKGTFF